MRIQQSPTSYLLFPIEHHTPKVGADGVVIIHAPMPTVLALFAEGSLPAIGGGPAEIAVGGRELGAMVLTELRCTGFGGLSDKAVLVLRPANAPHSPTPRLSSPPHVGFRLRGTLRLTAAMTPGTIGM